MVFINSNSIRSFSVFLLLSAYVFTICLDSLHPFFSHAHQAHETCSAEAEKDPCHKKIYHHDNQAGCHHDSHIHSPTHNCDFCDALVTLPVLFKEKEFESQHLLPSKASIALEETAVFKFFYRSSDPRGPPTPLV
ncbi:MAG: hypothetical protein AB8G15_04510 [Saprospiraceae bacterium]